MAACLVTQCGPSGHSVQLLFVAMPSNCAWVQGGNLSGLGFSCAPRVANLPAWKTLERSSEGADRLLGRCAGP